MRSKSSSSVLTCASRRAGTTEMFTVRSWISDFEGIENSSKQNSSSVVIQALQDTGEPIGAAEKRKEELKFGASDLTRLTIVVHSWIALLTLASSLLYVRGWSQALNADVKIRWGFSLTISSRFFVHWLFLKGRENKEKKIIIIMKTRY